MAMPGVYYQKAKDNPETLEINIHREEGKLEVEEAQRVSRIVQDGKGRAQ